MHLFFSDEDLYNYIADAVDELELSLFKKDRYVDGGNFKKTTTDEVANSSSTWENDLCYSGQQY